MTNQLPPHLQALFEKRDEIFKECGAGKDPAEFLIECKRKAEEAGDDDALIHAAL